MAPLRAIGRSLKVPTKGWVFHADEAVEAVYVVLEGEVRLSRFARDGSEIVLHKAGRGDFFAEASLEAARYPCNAIASRPSVLLVLPAVRMRQLIAEDRDFARHWASLLARQLHKARARAERATLRSASERVIHYLHTEGTGPRYETAVTTTIKDLAQELGLTHESLYRTLARLEREGVVTREEGRLMLHE
jgi:CRP-like cAMP-binding protein